MTMGKICITVDVEGVQESQHKIHRRFSDADVERIVSRVSAAAAQTMTPPIMRTVRGSDHAEQ